MIKKILIKNSWESKDYGARRLIWQFPNKNWERRGIEDLLRKLRETGSLDLPNEKWQTTHIAQCDNISVEEMTHFRKVALHLNNVLTLFRRGEDVFHICI